MEGVVDNVGHPEDAVVVRVSPAAYQLEGLSVGGEGAAVAEGAVVGDVHSSWHSVRRTSSASPSSGEMKTWLVLSVPAARLYVTLRVAAFSDAVPIVNPTLTWIAGARRRSR